MLFVRAITAALVFGALGPPIGGLVVVLSLLVAGIFQSDPAKFIASFPYIAGFGMMFSYLFGGLQAGLAAIYMGARIGVGGRPGYLETAIAGAAAAWPANWIQIAFLGLNKDRPPESGYYVFVAALGLASALVCRWLFELIDRKFFGDSASATDRSPKPGKS